MMYDKRFLLRVLVLLALLSGQAHARPPAIGKVTVFLDPAIAAERQAAFAEFEIASRTVERLSRQLGQYGDFSEDSENELRVEVTGFRLRSNLTAGLAGPLHSGRDGLFVMVSLKQGDQSRYIIKTRAKTGSGWLFFTLRNARADKLVNRVVQNIAREYHYRH